MGTLGLVLSTWASVATVLSAHWCISSCLCVKCQTPCQIWKGSVQWRHNGRDNVSNHQPHDCLLNRLLRRRSKKASKLRVTCFCAGNSPGTGEFPAQMASNAENISIWWRHHLTSKSWSWCVRYSLTIPYNINHKNKVIKEIHFHITSLCITHTYTW